MFDDIFTTEVFPESIFPREVFPPEVFPRKLPTLNPEKDKKDEDTPRRV